MLVFQALTIISSQVIIFTAHYSSGDIAVIDFTVNNSYEKKETQNKLAITKWLKEQWKHCLAHLQSEGLTPTCTTYNDDGLGFYRYRVYRKLGFKPVYGLGLVWGDYNPEDIDLEDSPPLPFYLQDYYVEWEHYEEDAQYWSGTIYSDQREGTWEYSPEFEDDDNWRIKWKPTPIDWEYWQEIARGQGIPPCNLYSEDRSDLDIAFIMAEWWEQRGNFREERIVKRLGIHDYF